MRYKNCCEKVLEVDGNNYSIMCPKSLEAGDYCIENGASLELAQVNGSTYGWFIGGLPILNKETDHAIFAKEYKELFDTLETSSFWSGTIYEKT